jgi:hypothetical protein
MKQIGNYGGIEGVKCYDFSDLFNTICIDDLVVIVSNLFEKYDLRESITFNRYKSVLKLVLKETYLYNDSNYYKQIHGI